MKGTRPLTTDEIIAVSTKFDGTYEVRNRSLFLLGVSVGGRISELLALRISDVWQNNQPIGDLLFQKDVVKGKETARMIPCNADGRQAINELIQWHKEQFGNLDLRRPFFPSRKFSGALSRSQAHRILEKAFQQAGLNGKLATHSLRKTFAQRIYDASSDIFLVQELLGHRDVETTKQYLGVSYAKMQRATQAIEINNRTGILLHSILDTSTEALIVELQTRGIDMTSAIQQIKAEHEPKQVAAGSKVVAFPRRG